MTSWSPAKDANFPVFGQLLLRQGDLWVRKLFVEADRSLDDKQHEPRLIENVFESLKSVSVGIERRWCFPFEFHGDAARFEGEVDVVSAYSGLSSKFASEHLSEMTLVAAADEIGVPYGCNGGISTLNPPVALPVSKADRHAGFFESFGKYSSGSAVFGRETAKRLTSEILLRDRLNLGNDDFRGTSCSSDVIRRRANSDFVPDSFANYEFANSHQFADRLEAFPFLVELDHVIDIESVIYSGHVYDLQTYSKWYSVSGIIVHNCTVVTEFGMDESEAQALIGDFYE